jgi:hypothetical protein
MDFTFSPPGFCQRESQVFPAQTARKILTFQMLAAGPTYARRILDQTTQELYIPPIGVPDGFEAPLYTGWGGKKQGKTPDLQPRQGRALRKELPCG